MAKILLIEDDHTMVNLLTTLLGIEGYDVVRYKGEQDILNLIQQELPDVILLDVNLKYLENDVGNGFDLLNKIREHQDLKEIRVIMSSGMNYQIESKTAGADGFLMKPYMPDDLLQLIEGKQAL
jgi:CheY-like chemotaxis protein